MRPPRVRLELPAGGLSAVPALRLRDAAWDRIAELAAGSASMLLFCQTRGEVERSAAALEQRLAALGLSGQVGAHHGSLDRSHRERIEARFRAGHLRLMVSSASLELGLDLGRVERVAQFGVPGSAALLCQRAGRSNHRPEGRPLIHLFPLTLSQLIEAEALRDCVDRGVHEAPVIAGNEEGAEDAPLDVLWQQVLAMIDEGLRDIDALHERVRRAWPYRNIELAQLGRLIEMACSTPELLPARQATRLLQRDPDGTLRTAIQAGRLLALNAGVIPEYFEYEVRRVDNGERVGRLDEEFAFESSPGDLVQLGHCSWRIVRVRPGEVLVEPESAPATQLPFWFGDGAGRSALVADAVRQRFAAPDGHREVRRMLEQSRLQLGMLPGPKRIVIERFPDPAGDRHLVIHSLAGVRVNRAWGLALRKRFCRQFNFELQAAATDDGVLISLGVTSEFEPGEIVRFVRAAQAEQVLIQALLDTPLFVTRFRWCASNALQLLRRDASGAIPAQRQRNATENLIACVFPDQLACLENLAGPRRIPDHPLVMQALRDCLHEHMDLAGLIELLRQIEDGAIRVHAVDLEQPSPLAAGLLQAPQHSFLDPAAAEERRTRAFEPRPAAAPLQLRPRPVAAAPAVAGAVAGADALERLLDRAGFLTAAEGERGLGLARPVPVGGWTRSFSTLARERRALAVRLGPQSPWMWMTTAVAAALRRRVPSLELRPWISPSQLETAADKDELLFERLARGRAELRDGDDAGTLAALAAAARWGAAA
jgi:ATP-dependent Lhr-like helicase